MPNARDKVGMRPDHTNHHTAALDGARLDEVAARAEAAGRELLAMAPTPKQRGTVALVALHAIEREFARAVQS